MQFNLEHEGILVASGIIKASSWYEKILDLSQDSIPLKSNMELVLMDIFGN